MRLSFVLFLLAGCGTGPPPVTRTSPSGPASYFLAIAHDDQMSESFRLVGLKVSLADQVLFDQNVDTEDGGGDAHVQTPICVYRRLVPAGTHDVSVDLLYRGRGHGVFSYLSSYRFAVRSTHAVDVPTDAFGVHVTSVGVESGGATAPLDERPAVRWAVEPERDDPNAGCHPGVPLALAPRRDPS